MKIELEKSMSDTNYILKEDIGEICNGLNFGKDVVEISDLIQFYSNPYPDANPAEQLMIVGTLIDAHVGHLGLVSLIENDIDYDLYHNQEYLKKKELHMLVMRQVVDMVDAKSIRNSFDLEDYLIILDALDDEDNIHRSLLLEKNIIEEKDGKSQFSEELCERVVEILKDKQPVIDDIMNLKDVENKLRLFVMNDSLKGVSNE